MGFQCTKHRISYAAHPARNAHLISTLALNLLRVTVVPACHTPLECPLAPLFAAQQVLNNYLFCFHHFIRLYYITSFSFQNPVSKLHAVNIYLRNAEVGKDPWDKESVQPMIIGTQIFNLLHFGYPGSLSLLGITWVRPDDWMSLHALFEPFQITGLHFHLVRNHPNKDLMTK